MKFVLILFKVDPNEILHLIFFNFFLPKIVVSRNIDNGHFFLFDLWNFSLLSHFQIQISHTFASIFVSLFPSKQEKAQDKGLKFLIFISIMLSTEQVEPTLIPYHGPDIKCTLYTYPISIFHFYKNPPPFPIP